MTQRFTIPGRLDGLNEYTRECRANKYSGNKVKRANQRLVLQALASHRIKPVKRPVILHCRWVEKDRRRDYDNVRFGIKFIQDALVEMRIIPDDSPNWVLGYTDKFEHDKKSPRVEVEIVEVDDG